MSDGESIEYTGNNLETVLEKVREWTGKDGTSYTLRDDGCLIVQGPNGEPVEIDHGNLVGPPTYEGGPIVVTELL